jgi:transcriptional regulator with XRE-family HTH domain
MARGAVCGGVQERRFKSGEQWEVLRREEGTVIVGKDGAEKQLPLDQTRKFSVFERQKIKLSIGDRIRFTKNVKHHGQKFLNNELRTVVGIDDGKIILDKGEIVRNGAALHLDQGIAVTSHASQAKTVDQAIASVTVRAFSQANEAQFYVTMSRARWAMHVFTDSKVALRDAIARSSKRLSSWELTEEAIVSQIGVNHHTLRRWLSDKQSPRKGKLALAAAFLRVFVSVLPAVGASPLWSKRTPGADNPDIRRHAQLAPLP